jgi:branched-chain amino acid transport system substrate-binding protein
MSTKNKVLVAGASGLVGVAAIELFLAAGSDVVGISRRKPELPGGRGSVEAARMAAEEFSGAIAGKHIEIVSADHQNKPDIGAAIARQWFNVEHVDVITDLASSAVGFAVVEVAKPLNKIVLVSGPGSSDFTRKATWDTYGAATTTARAIVGPGANTWFFIASDYAFGHALERYGASAVEKAGGRVVGRVWPLFNNADFSSFLLQAQQSGAAVIAFATAGQDTINLVKQAAEFGLTKPGTLPKLASQMRVAFVRMACGGHGP